MQKARTTEQLIDELLKTGDVEPEDIIRIVKTNVKARDAQQVQSATPAAEAVTVASAADTESDIKVDAALRLFKVASR